MVIKNREKILLSLLLFIFSLSIYLFKLDKIPSGFHGDEAELSLFSESLFRNGLKAIIGVGQHNHPLISFLPQVLSFKLFNVSVFTARLPSAIFSALSVPLFFIFLLNFFNSRTAFLSSLLFMTSHIWIAMSRLAINNSQIVFFELLTFYFLLLLLKTKRTIYFVFLGFCCGMIFYLYAGFRIVPIIVSLILIKELLFGNSKKLLLKGLAISIVSFFLISLPQVVFFAQNNTALTARAESIFIFGNSGEVKEWRENNYRGMDSFEILKEQTKKTLMISNPRDTSGQYGYPSYVLDPITSMLAALGIIMSFRFIKQSRYILLIIWVLLTLIMGNILAINPFFLPRAIGVIPVIYVFAGLAINVLLRSNLNRHINKLIFFLVCLLVVFAITINLEIYFKDSEKKMFGDPNKYTATKIGYFLKQLDTENNIIFLTAPAIHADFSSIRFISRTFNRRYIIQDIIDPKSYIASPLSKTVFIISPIYESLLKKIQIINPQGKLLLEKDMLGRKQYYVYQLP